MTKYITTPIYYPNAKPHIGTAYTTIICDVLARYNRLFGHDVVFTTGLDEHGQKIQESAEKNNMTPQQWVDHMNEDFEKLWKVLDISYDDYVRTTQDRHIFTVEDIIQKVYDNGDIYEGEYIGKYCVSEETFVTESQLVDGKYLGKEVIDVSEPTYFFRLSKYGDKLLKFYEDNPNFIMPKQRRNEVISFINKGLQDLSITRTTFDWGIPIKMNDKHVIYVWFDALNSYLTGAKYGKEDFDRIWNNSEISHFIGKDILRFHAIIWPAMLMSAGIKLPEHVVAHGWWTVNGEKMSKSVGNVVDPFEEVENYGLDAFRYFLIRESSFASDADYSRDALITRINSDLANDLGNLLNRTIGMQKKYFGDEILESSSKTELEEKIYEEYNNLLSIIQENLKSFELSDVLKNTWKFISRLNKYIDESEPWILHKNGDIERLRTVMYTLFDMLRKIAYLVSPVLVNASKLMLDQMGLDDNTRVNILEIGDIKVGTKISNAVPIFPRIELKKTEYKEDLVIKDAINIQDFNRINIQVVEILKVSKVKDSNNLLKFIVDTGTEKRQIVSGVAKYYPDLEELVSKKVLCVTNLEIVEIANEVSQGMLLTTVEKKKTKLIEVENSIKNGSKIK